MLCNVLFSMVTLNQWANKETVVFCGSWDAIQLLKNEVLSSVVPLMELEDNFSIRLHSHTVGWL